MGGGEALLALGAESVDDGKDEEEVDDELLEDEEVGVVVPEVVEGEDVATDEEEDVDDGEGANGAADYAQEKGRHQKKHRGVLFFGLVVVDMCVGGVGWMR